ncbi:MAG: S-methyl-5-thioribose-1-phosphate isomerase [Xanthomonadaceae bacterium]|nr:S-methyl-5-thioribose-1-phosphate isomerase [Xanthomonadaceae bacterium]
MKKRRVESIRWHDGRLLLLDQRDLPTAENWVEMPGIEAIHGAISDLLIRGAPAIGIAAAYGCVLAAAHRVADTSAWHGDLDRLIEARPTAVNLRWAIERMRATVADGSTPGAALADLERAACKIHSDDLAANQEMARAGASYLAPGSRVLTHCNTGSLATAGVGTALGVIVRAWHEGRLKSVHACETRPWLQGLRLTAWELAREQVPCNMLVESAAASLLQAREIDWVITGADRIAANGDVANKIGTLMLAVLARHFGARMMVVAPRSTVDPDTADGRQIQIEHRPADEIWSSAGIAGGLPGIGAFNPVFDVTPARLIDLIVTEGGVLRPPYEQAISGLFGAL